jgi:uncharacterized metal-binding protein
VPNQKILVIPCSGIGKSLGTVSRKATYKIIEELRPDYARTTCLALLTVGDEETLKLVRENPCMSIDGCPAQCATKNIEAVEGRLVRRLLVTDVLRKYRDLKPEGVIKLNAAGEKLASLLADEVATEIDKVGGDKG